MPISPDPRGEREPLERPTLGEVSDDILFDELDPPLARIDGVWQTVENHPDLEIVVVTSPTYDNR